MSLTFRQWLQIAVTLAVVAIWALGLSVVPTAGAQTVTIVGVPQSSTVPAVKVGSVTPLTTRLSVGTNTWNGTQVTWLSTDSTVLSIRVACRGCAAGDTGYASAKRAGFATLVAITQSNTASAVSLAVVDTAKTVVSIPPKPIYVGPTTWAVRPSRGIPAITFDTVIKGVVGDTIQLCVFASDTEPVNGHRWVRHVLMSMLSPNPVCAIAFRMWDSVQTKKAGGAWP